MAATAAVNVTTNVLVEFRDLSESELFFVWRSLAPDNKITPAALQRYFFQNEIMNDHK